MVMTSVFDLDVGKSLKYWCLSMGEKQENREAVPKNCHTDDMRVKFLQSDTTFSGFDPIFNKCILKSHLCSKLRNAA